MEFLVDQLSMIRGIVEWIVEFIIDFIAPWILDRGGWVSVFVAVVGKMIACDNI